MKTKDGRHKFKWRTYKGRRIRIDEEIAPLLDKMWALGIGTNNSCQQHCSFLCGHTSKVKKIKKENVYVPVRTPQCKKDVWISFESSRDVEKLYNIIAEYDPSSGTETMYSKMSCDRFVQTHKTKYICPEGWAFGFLMENQGVEGHWGRRLTNGKRETREGWIEDGCKKNKFVIRPQITFPRKHLKYVNARLDLALNKSNKS